MIIIVYFSSNLYNSITRNQKIIRKILAEEMIQKPQGLPWKHEKE